MAGKARTPFSRPCPPPPNPCMQAVAATKFRVGDSFGHGLTASARIVCHTHDSEVLVVPREAYDEVMGCKVGGDIEEVLEVFQKRYGCGSVAQTPPIPSGGFLLAVLVACMSGEALSVCNAVPLPHELAPWDLR